MVNRAPSRGDWCWRVCQTRSHSSASHAAISYADAVAATASSRSAKRLSALPGDSVEVVPDYIAVNGQRLEHSATLSRDSQRPISEARRVGSLHRADKSGVVVRNQGRAKLGLSLLRAGAGELGSSRAGAGSHVVSYGGRTTHQRAGTLESIISRISAGWSRLRGWTVSRPTCCSVDYLNSQHVCPTCLLHVAPRSLQPGA